MEGEWHQFLPPIWFKRKKADASSEMKIVHGLIWTDARDDCEDGPPMQEYHRIPKRGLPMGPYMHAKFKNQMFKRRCQRRHRDLAYLGRENVADVLQELKRQFRWAPQLGHWERRQWEISDEERQQRGATEAGTLVFERKIKR